MTDLQEANRMKLAMFRQAIRELKEQQYEVARGSMLDVIDYFKDKENPTYEELTLMTNLEKDYNKLKEPNIDDILF